MAENTTRQLDRWKQGDAVTAYRLNQLVEAVNFLLNTTGYIFNRVALSNYVPTDASSFNYPGILEAVETRAGLTAPRIEAGTLVLPEQTGAGLNAVTYDATAQTPSISNGTLKLNLAHYDPSSGSAFPGAIAGVSLYAPSSPSAPTAPDIYFGELRLPQFITEAEYTGSVRTPTVDKNLLQLPLAHNDPSTGINTPGALESVLLYDPSDPSSPPSPGIFNGIAKLPRGVESASYSEAITEPTVSGGKLSLPLAHSDASAGSYIDRTGSIAGLRLYDPSDPSSPSSPGIFNGLITIPAFSAAGVSAVRYGSTGSVTPAPGVDGWVQTLYLWGLYTGNLDHLYATRQLMRVNGSVLEIVQQITYDDGNSWTESSA